jgi:hypothetical protein
VIVHNLNIVGVAIPSEADAPLVIDPNAVLPGAIPAKGFKTIAWRDTKVVQPGRRIEQLQLAPRDTLERPEAPHRKIAKEALRVPIAKALDHAAR